ncbi:MAG: V-type ATP synthase subunit E family protein [Candidatus Delongbacteria bacterium]|nr:V-type ATP synthase subunit E family protein [Candidatus Delongbacteria bacterium]
MEKKLQELTEKIYSEGVEKAKIEAENIVKEAKAKAEKELNNAQNEAKKIIEAANKKSDEIKRNGESEMKLAAKQALSEVKQKITDVITTGVISENVKIAMDDNEFVKGLIETSIKSLSSEGSMDLEVILPDDKKSDLAEYLKSNAGKLLKGELVVSLNSEMANGFKIGPADGSYKMSFTDDDFANFFKRYLRPKTITLLFEGE